MRTLKTWIIPANSIRKFNKRTTKNLILFAQVRYSSWVSNVIPIISQEEIVEIEIEVQWSS